ncbi:class F sortase [Saccharomonospora piscinae]|uniref:class F sortase n=1 Tax=Saccharomonospora piscinae TaxID=687388 RepID=UPI0011057FEB|nr:class F sortase [Saccharomonospora piscinae]TLW91814.1 class F sortase [Saccharomonospora piscinae]
MIPSTSGTPAAGESRRRIRRAYLLGASSVLAVELLIVGVLALRSPVVVAGTAVPATTTAPAPAQSQPDTEDRDDGGDGNDTHDTGDTDDGNGDGDGERSSEPTQPAAERPATAPSGQRPGTVRLPDGGTATLVREELGADSVLPVPDDLDEATWWGAGLDAPSGASVFAGHVNWRGSVGPFSELWDVRAGERVTVADEDGTRFHYAVTQILTLGKDELPARAGELFGQSGSHRLVLVTCGGRWLGGTTGYAENRVVIAEPV